MTGPHEPEDPREPEDGAPGSDVDPTPVEPPTEPGWRTADGAPEPGPHPVADGAPPRRAGWRSRGVRLGVAGTLAALLLLGGGVGIGYAVADAAHPAAVHAATAEGHGRKGAAAGRRQRGERGCTTPPAAGASGRPASTTT